MDHDNPDHASMPSLPQYAQRARHRPSPKGEQRLWLYQCAVKSCSKGDTKIAGTSRPKGRDVPSCGYCGGKMHWKGTERDPTLQGGGVSGNEISDSVTSAGNTLIVPTASAQARGSHSPPPPMQSQSQHSASSFTPVPQNSSISASSTRSTDGTRLTPGSSATAEASPSPSSGENRGGRPWEL